MNEIMEGAATDAQISGFAIALRMKGETAIELAGLARAMLDHATPISVPGRLVDLVGTGADGAHTVNISTMATIVAAAAGARMVKHGNRAASSKCGAADVLEALGVVINLPPAATVELAAEIGAAFLFAPLYHPALRHAGPTRSQLGVPTVFNFLGPVANPARPQAQAVGVADARMGGVIAGVLAARGASALVFHGGDGLDELTTTTTSSVWLVHSSAVAAAELDPAELGLPRSDRRRPARWRRRPQRGRGAGRAGRRGGPGTRHRAAERGGGPGRRGGRAQPGGPGPGAVRRAGPGRGSDRFRCCGGAARALDKGQSAPGGHRIVMTVAADPQAGARRADLRAGGRTCGPAGGPAVAAGRASCTKRCRLRPGRTRPPGRAVSRRGTRCASRCA